MEETTNTETEVKEVAKETSIVTPSKFKSLIEAIEKMSVLDLHELVKHLEEKFGVTASPALPAVASSAGVAATSEPAEEQTSFTVVLKDAGAHTLKFGA